MQLSTIVKPLKEAEKTLELCRPDSTSVYLFDFGHHLHFTICQVLSQAIFIFRQHCETSKKGTVRSFFHIRKPKLEARAVRQAHEVEVPVSPRSWGRGPTR